MRVISIDAIANQSFTIVQDEQRYDFVIKETRGSMSVSIARDSVELVSNIRMVNGTPLLPYKHLMEGNFFLVTEEDEYPYYTQFGITQQLIYLTVAEIEALQVDGLITPDAFAPSLAFNFTTAQSIISAEGFAATFTRASIASYFDSEGLLAYAANNQARFDYNPLTLASEGLLIESTSTNICLYSEAADNAAWVKTNASISSGSAIAPDGAQTADSLADNVTNGVHRMTQTVAFANTTAYTYSVFLKAGARTNAVVALPAAAFPGTPYCFVNLITGELGTPQDCTAEILPLPNGWWRLSITATSDAAVSGGAYIGTAQNLTIDSYVGDGGGIYVWGAQIEARAYASSYIATTSVSATRAAESLSLATGGGWLAEQLGTFYTESKLSHAGIAAERVIGELSDGTAANVLKHFIDGTDGNKRKIEVVAGSVDQFTYDRTAYTFPAVTRSATAYRENAVIGAIDGVLSTFDDSAVIPDFTQLSFGSAYAGTLPLSGWVRELQYYPYYLENQVLRGMTE